MGRRRNSDGSNRKGTEILNQRHLACDGIGFHLGFATAAETQTCSANCQLRNQDREGNDNSPQPMPEAGCTKPWTCSKAAWSPACNLLPGSRVIEGMRDGPQTSIHRMAYAVHTPRRSP